jgi:non-specific serine/threonine protein kinase
MDTAMLREQRGAAERDVLACGVVLHHLLAGSPAFGVVDTAAAMARIAPLGIEILRLPTETPATSLTRCERSSIARPRRSHQPAIEMRARCSVRSAAGSSRTRANRPGRSR